MITHEAFEAFLEKKAQLHKERMIFLLGATWGVIGMTALIMLSFYIIG